MNSYWKWFYFCTVVVLSTEACNRKPQGANGERTPADDRFQILIDGNPTTYIPGQQYNVSISAAGKHKFTSFTLVVESESLNSDMFGHFEIVDSADTKFSMGCQNLVENTNSNAKSHIVVAWIAPTNPNSSCVLIKAGVLQHRNVWFVDDGFLTKRICPEEIDEVNSQTPPVNPCCACDEARYEIIIERKWTRNTHAKDFPAETWRTRFSTVIGASHTFEYRFWEYGTRATPGLRELAEHGATQALEDEIKENISNENIRTIIKAPGINYHVNIVGTTIANVRMDAKHHLISLVTKIIPSPDWILGISGLELCLINCTWVERKTLNLYPWDIGTDAGPSYMSPDQPQVPADVTRRITSTFPSDERSPFYDDLGIPMKPLATLHVIRKRIYERNCDTEEDTSLECVTHPWNNWSNCSSRCGSGTQNRTRFYKDHRLAERFNCNVELNQTQDCVGEQCGDVTDDQFTEDSNAECELTSWSYWSGCSKSCGKGISTRTRDYINSFAREKCQNNSPVKLKQVRDCEENLCGGSLTAKTQSNMNSNIDEYDSTEDNSYGEKYNRFSKNKQTSNINTGYDRKTTNRGRAYERNRLENDRVKEDFAEKENTYENDRLVGNVERPNLFNREPYSENQNENTNKMYNRKYFDEIEQNKKNRYENYNVPRYNNQPYQNVVQNRNQQNRNNEDNFDNERKHGIDRTVSGSDVNEYMVVQEYCLEKPTPYCKECKKSKVIVSNYWFYDAEDRQCKLFTADNCDENKNKFRTLESCEATCNTPIENFEESQQEEQNSNSWNSNGRQW
ncbi:spondin-1 [Teleopsis dalmanni]|uniref:spondin-1 n=1 Tax=Teleopsis dalmanni TaxID=139649 RepID=UPI0018CD77A9|nr:spondin-1 [Teleopsis dalmanni]